MNQLHTIMMVLAIGASVGTIVNFSVESVDAWHLAEQSGYPNFQSKNECTNYMQDIFGNTTQPNLMCQKLLPHELHNEIKQEN